VYDCTENARQNPSFCRSISTVFEKLADSIHW